ncbi:hypothetical protein C2G38_1369986 [Gigaspora rosea]|uniref:Uncharacterized protein n=1 Tax=Gigaspora rosea TaxID=44941 RepID=A0A397VDX9_9GLOM|nr:hypothetical protein C2G38_1369986 [Gigaspora rosea]
MRYNNTTSGKIKRAIIAFEDVSSFLEGKVDAPSWVLEARKLGKDVRYLKPKEILWMRPRVICGKRTNVEELGFDHPICSGILDVSSESLNKISPQLRTTFKAPSRRYLIPPNQMLMKFCEDFVRKEEEKRQTKTSNTLSDVSFGKFIDSSEELIELTKQLLEALGRNWASPKWNSL